jgi:ribose 5-phosphate isomerase B
MKLMIGADHRGAEAANRLSERLMTLGHQVRVISPPPGEACDYPEPAWDVGKDVAAGACDMGILICGTGVGMCIAANKVAGVRAASVHDEITAELSRSHNDANVICVSADLLGQRLIEKIVDLFIATPFGGGRHERRVAKIKAMEQGRDPRVP